jgi:hypothetical protein
MEGFVAQRWRPGRAAIGGEGPSLVKGVGQNLSAAALSIRPGGSVEDPSPAPDAIAWADSSVKSCSARSSRYHHGPS